jgi:hypothetical protein
MQVLGFGSLWLQVLIVSVATFVLSALFWVVAPWHKTEFKRLPDEDAIRKLLNAQGVGEGQWRIPYCATKDEATSPAHLAKIASGPVGIFQIEKPGGSTMGPRLIKSFVLYFFIALFTATMLRHSVVSGAAWRPVFHLAFGISFASHAIGHVQDAIWFSKSWRRVLFQALDSFVYALATAAIFAAMWPGR